MPQPLRSSRPLQWTCPACPPTKETNAMPAVRRLLASCPVLGALVAVSADPPPGRDTTGTVIGVVRFTAPVPPPKKVMTTEGGTLLHSDLVVDAKTKGLRDV